LKDMYRAFELTGPGILADPGSAGTITVTMYWQICSVVTAAAETRTLAQPNRPGIIATVVLKTDGGDLTLTVTGGYNQDADTAMVFADAGDFVTFISLDIGGSYYWRVLTHAGELVIPSASPSHTASHTPSATPTSSPSHTPSHTASHTPSHTPSHTASHTPSHTASHTPSHTASSS